MPRFQAGYKLYPTSKSQAFFSCESIKKLVAHIKQVFYTFPVNKQVDHFADVGKILKLLTRLQFVADY
nr:MAG TPA: hypothetical protein [Caudoviricetes sp.]